MIKLVDRYVGRSTLVGVLAVWLSLTLLMAMFTLIDQLGNTGAEGGVVALLTFVLLKSINGAYIVFPVAALLGAMIGVGGLAAGNELVAFRTAGVSRLRLSGSVLGAVALLSVGVMALGEFVMPNAEKQANSLEARQLEASQAGTGGRDIWIRDGEDYIHIGRFVVTGDALADTTLREVVRYRFDEDRALNRVDRAASAFHDGTRWHLVENTITEVGDQGVVRRFEADLPWDASFEPELLSTAVVRPRYMSMRDIRDQIDYLERNGLDRRAYTSVLWTKMLFPLSVLALVLAGMPFLFGSSRTQSMGVRIFIGMSLGGVFMIVSKTMQNLSEAYDLPSWLGAGLPSLALATVVILVLRRSV
ncbi:MAG: LPS export ABC transporter permease LptG [Xanthomonadales bacterium]|nr:LPS export ABC transporter permease LptG [Xanthomonadales bacterium]